MSEREEQLAEFMAKMFRDGHFIDKGDGTFDVSDEVRELVQRQLTKDPTLFGRLFPERVQ